MKNKSGFTLVELIVVIAILGILTVIAVFNYLNVQRQARDEQRATDVTVVSESLEKYFAENGEYPSVTQITDTNGNTVKQLLGLTGLDSLVAPFASGTTNSWKAGSSNTADTLTFTYSGNTDTSASCNSGTLATDRCMDFKIQYYNEEEDTLVTVTSRNKTVAVNVTQREGVVTPDGPTVNVALVGSNATATASTVTCQVGATARYAFQNRTNDGTWSAWSAWGTSATNAVAATEGAKYGFRAKAQCQVGTVVSTDSTISAEDTYIRPIATPGTPNPWITAPFRPNYVGKCIDAAGGSSAAGTAIQIYDCNGSLAQDWSYDSGDGTFRLSSARSTCIQQMNKGAQVRLQTCDGGTDQQWTADYRGWYINVYTGFCLDGANYGTANGTPIITWDCTGGTAQIWNPADSQSAWTWTATTCPAGATVEYQANNQATSVADSGWFSTGTTARTVRTTVNQGYTYITQVRARCYSSYISSSWSGTGSSGLVKAVYKPGDATGWAFAPWSGRNGWGWSWDSPACGAGTNRSYIEESWTGTTNNSGGTLLYWLAPRTPNGPGNIWWYTADSTGGAAYVWYAPASNGRGDTFVSYPSGNLPYGVNVIARTQYRCVNPVTGRSATGDWTQSVTNYT